MSLIVGMKKSQHIGVPILYGLNLQFKPFVIIRISESIMKKYWRDLFFIILFIISHQKVQNLHDAPHTYKQDG